MHVKRRDMVINGMLKDENIIIISSIAWNMEWQGHHRLTFWCARHAGKVLYVNNLPKRIPSLVEIFKILNRFNAAKNKSQKFNKHQDALAKFKNVEIINTFALPSVNRLH